MLGACLCSPASLHSPNFTRGTPCPSVVNRVTLVPVTSLQLLRGFLDGLSDGDPTVKRLPCALQAYDPLAEGATGGHYVGARVSEAIAPKLDALNLHIYSFFSLMNGTRIAVHPEHPGSHMNGEHKGQQLRDGDC